MVAERVWRASRNVPCHVRWRGLPPAVCRQPEWSCGGAESFRWWGDVAPRVSEGEPRFQHDRVPVARWVEVHVVKTAQTDPPVHIRAPALGRTGRCDAFHSTRRAGHSSATGIPRPSRQGPASASTSTTGALSSCDLSGFAVVRSAAFRLPRHARSLNNQPVQRHADAWMPMPTAAASSTSTCVALAFDGSRVLLVHCTGKGNRSAGRHNPRQNTLRLESLFYGAT